MSGAFLAVGVISFHQAVTLGSDSRYSLWHLLMVFGVIAGVGGAILLVTIEPETAPSAAVGSGDRVLVERRVWEDAQRRLRERTPMAEAPAWMETPRTAGRPKPTIVSPAAPAAPHAVGVAAGATSPEPTVSAPIPPASLLPRTDEGGPAHAPPPSPPAPVAAVPVPSSPPPSPHPVREVRETTTEEERSTLVEELLREPKRDKPPVVVPTPPAFSHPAPPVVIEECASCGTNVTDTPGRLPCTDCQRPLCPVCYRKSIQLGNWGRCPACSWRRINRRPG